MEKKYFGTDGIRGDVQSPKLSPEFVVKLGWAIGKFINSTRAKVIIGKDPRISGYMLEAALEAGLVASGVNVFLLGPLPTPGVAYLTKTFNADLGIMISASHNKYSDNGIKIFTNEGLKLNDEQELAIEQIVDSYQLDVVACNKIGRCKRIADACGRYIEFCKSSFKAKRSLDDLKIVIDCANGATYSSAPHVFSELGAEVIVINDKPNGFNINENCGSTHPQKLQQAVKDNNAVLGLAFDGDGDRIVIVDEHGDICDGDDILYIIVNHLMNREKMHGGVVGTVMTNLALENFLKTKKIPFIRTDVGDRFIVQELKNRDWTLGGENSGHILCLSKTTTGDGIITALQVLAAMINQEKTIRDLLKDFTKYPQKIINLDISQNGDILEQEEVKNIIKNYEKKLGKSNRLLIRKSGTEPVIRLMVEGPNENEISTFVEGLSKEIGSYICKS